MSEGNVPFFWPARQFSVQRFFTVTVSSAAASSRSPTECVALDWDSSSNQDGPNQPGQLQGAMQSSPWDSSIPAPLPPPNRSCTPTTPPVCLPLGIKSPVASDADDGLVGFKSVDCPRRPLADVFSLHKEDDRNWVDAWRVQQSSLTSRQETLLAHLRPEREPKPDHSLLHPHRFSAPALRRDKKNRRPTDKLQLLSWNLGPARGSDPRTLASHLNGPWHVVLCTRRSRLCH